MSFDHSPKTGGRLRRRLFLSYLLVIAVSMLGLLVATTVLAPRIFDRHIRTMMGGENGAMLGMMRDMSGSIEQAFRSAMLQAMLLGGGAATLAAVAASLAVSARIVNPVRRLLDASRRIAAGHYDQRVEVSGRDELSTLAEQFNVMADSLQHAEQRRQALIGDVAHELRTPLATLEGYTEGMLDGIVSSDPATLALLHDEVGRLRRLVQDLQEVSRAEARQIDLQRAPVAPAELAHQALARMEQQYAEKGVLLTGDVPANLPAVAADTDRILQVLLNLLGNALRHTPRGGRVSLTAELDRSIVVFHVADTGVGIAAEHLPHVFDRFYRIDKARSRVLGGSGIGLTIARALVEAHDGCIWAISAGIERGATFSFSLPVAASR